MEEGSTGLGPVPQLYEQVTASDTSESHRYTVSPRSRGGKRPLVCDESVADATGLVVSNPGEAPSGWTEVPFRLHKLDRQIKYLEAFTAASHQLAEAFRQLTETCLSHRPNMPPFDEAYRDRCWATALSIVDMQTYGIDILQQSLFHLQHCRRSIFWTTCKNPQIVESVNYLKQAHRVAELYEELDRSCMAMDGKDYRGLETTLRATLSEQRKCESDDPRIHKDFVRRFQSRQTEDLEQKQRSLALSFWEGEVPTIIAKLQSASSNLTLTPELRNWVLTVDPDWTPPEGVSVGVDACDGAPESTHPSSQGKGQLSKKLSDDGSAPRRYFHPRAALPAMEAPPSAQSGVGDFEESRQTEVDTAKAAASVDPGPSREVSTPSSTRPQDAKQKARSGTNHKVKRRRFCDLSEPGTKTQLFDDHSSKEKKSIPEALSCSGSSLTAAPNRSGGRGVVNSRRARQQSIDVWPKDDIRHGTTSVAPLTMRRPLVGLAISPSGPIQLRSRTSAAGRSDGTAASCHDDQTDQRATMAHDTSTGHRILGLPSLTYSGAVRGVKPSPQPILGGDSAVGKGPSQLRRFSRDQSLDEASISIPVESQELGQHYEGAKLTGPSEADLFRPPPRWETIETQMSEVFDNDGDASDNESAITDYADEDSAVSAPDEELTPAAYVPGQSSLTSYFGLERKRTTREMQEERGWTLEENDLGRSRSLADIRDLLDTESTDDLAEASQRYPRGSRWRDGTADGLIWR